jgi:hypothetical protein
MYSKKTHTNNKEEIFKNFQEGKIQRIKDDNGMGCPTGKQEPGR